MIGSCVPHVRLFVLLKFSLQAAGGVCAVFYNTTAIVAVPRSSTREEAGYCATVLYRVGPKRFYAWLQQV